MALRNQPYIPLYVQDYLTDEKLNMCSLSTQGVYIKLMCILHKQKEYGVILLKQKDKQINSTYLNFANKIAKLLPISIDDIKLAIVELIEEDVLIVDGDRLIQKRMVKDNAVSEARSKAGKKGGKRTQNNKDFAKAKHKANSEDENEDEIKDLIIPKEKVNFKKLENHQWFESLLRIFELKITMEKLMEYWGQFQEAMIADDDLYRDENNYKSHFRNWTKIQIEKNEKTRTNNRKDFKSDITEEAIESVKNGFTDYTHPDFKPNESERSGVISEN